MKKKLTTLEKKRLMMGISIGVLLLVVVASLYLRKTADNTTLMISAEGDLTQGIKGIQIRSEQSFSGDDQEQIEAVIKVDVKGEVLQPGVYSLPEGARLADAIELAGGTTSAASTRYLNLAQKVFDGMMVYIPNQEEAIQGDKTEGEGATGGKININYASQQELEKLPGIGPSKAQAIIRYREQHGLFQSLEDLQKVPGIGKSTFSQLESYIVH